MTYDPSDLPPDLRRRVLGSDLGCWIWQGSQHQGYGALVVRGRKFGAHRYVYETLVEPIPDDMTIDHLCRVTLCVNPDHLEVVSGSVNSQRANHWSRQPSPAKVAEAQDMRSRGIHELVIARELGVSRTTIRRWLNPVEAARSREKARAWKKANPEAVKKSGSGVCASCGGSTSARRVEECQGCRLQRAEDRKELIVERWSQGVSLQAIADELGWSVNQLGVTMYTIREQHPELSDKLPYRRVPKGKKASGSPL